MAECAWCGVRQRMNWLLGGAVVGGAALAARSALRATKGERIPLVRSTRLSRALGMVASERVHLCFVSAAPPPVSRAPFERNTGMRDNVRWHAQGGRRCG